jgi:hypothetical protein
MGSRFSCGATHVLRPDVGNDEVKASPGLHLYQLGTGGVALGRFRSVFWRWGLCMCFD